MQPRKVALRSAKDAPKSLRSKADSGQEEKRERDETRAQAREGGE